MQLLDCTLRDGANVVGNGFDAELTKMMLEGLIKNHITLIEFGNAYGIGAYDAKPSVAPLTDLEYLDLVQPYLSQAEIGMFMGAANANEKNIALAAEKGLKFLRIGENASDGKHCEEGIKLVKKYGMTARYSMMKAYVLSPKELAEEAKMLESFGLDAITIMDSAGRMLPKETYEYVSEMVKAVKIPVGFHGHNNLGLSVANALVAEEAGAATLDCGLMGMARSAGNLSTEIAVAAFQRIGKAKEIDFYGLLDFIDQKLAPAMKTGYDYRAAVCPKDLTLGYSGCHSNFLHMFESVAKEKNVNLYKLIIDVSAKNMKNPSMELIEEVAGTL